MVKRKQNSELVRLKKARPLDVMPSSGSTHPDVRSVLTRRSRGARLVRILGLFFVVVVVLPLLFALLAGQGALDGFLADRVRQYLHATLDERFSSSVGSAGIRFADGGRIAIEARDVEIAGREDGRRLIGAGRVKFAVRIGPLLYGELVVSQIEINHAFVNAPAIGLVTARSKEQAEEKPFLVENIGPLAATVLERVRSVSGQLAQNNVSRLLVSDLTLLGTGTDGVPEQAGSGQGAVISRGLQNIVVKKAKLTGSSEGSIDFTATTLMSGTSVSLDIEATTRQGERGSDALKVSLHGIRVGELIERLTGNPERKFRLKGSADIDLDLQRSAGAVEPEISGSIELSGGELFMDGVGATLHRSRFNLAYDNTKKSLEVLPSALNIGGSTYSFNGGFIDLKNLPDQKKSGIAFDLVVDSAVVAPSDSTEPPANVAMKAFSRYVRDERKIYVDEFLISSATGTLYSSAGIQITDTSPQISFAANVDRMDTSTVKQLWPYWIAKGARNWVLQNLFGGTIRDGSIRVFIPQGHLAALPNPPPLSENQLKLDFNIENARFDVAGDIPPVRNSSGVLKLRGERLELDLDNGTSFLPTGRSVEIAQGRFVIAQTRDIPLMADLNIKVSGNADAVAEIVSYRPIDALRRTSFQPKDFSGRVRANVDVTFGLIQQQNPPEPDWTVELDLEGVSVEPMIDGVKVTDASGKMFVDPDYIRFDTDAVLDGIAARVDFIEPLDARNAEEKQRVVTLTADENDRAVFAPLLNDYVKGNVGLKITLHGDGRQSVEADLSQATVLLPWIGWSKGKGVRSNVTFQMEIDGGDGGSDSVPDFVKISNIDLKGNGFSAQGNLDFDKVGLLKADISRATLNRDDRFAMRIVRKAETYDIAVNGDVVDLRAATKHLLSDSTENAEASSDERVNLTVKARKAIGFYGETLSPFELSYSGKGTTIYSLDLAAKTANGIPVSMTGRLANGTTTVQIRTADAGVVGRIVDIYDKVQGGKLEAVLKKTAGGPYRGTVKIEDFRIVDEERLESLVSSKPQGGQSLNEAVRRDINVSQAFFDQGYARIDKGTGYLKIQDGVIRGPEIGSTFQGTFYDQRGNIDITGTFMPAYGVNRLFGEIPIVGAILGNGRDRGLIGITYRLSGKFEDPKLTINPISLIAPGIFRSMFQFNQRNGGSSSPRIQQPTMER